MKLNRSMNSVMSAARSIEVRATAKSDTTILKAYKAFQRICDVEKKYSTHVLDYSNALINVNTALIEIEEAIESVGRHGAKYFEDEFIQNSADILDRSCPDITGQINAMYNNIATLEQLNTIYLSAQAVKDRIMMYCITQSDCPTKEKEDAKSSVSNNTMSSIKYEKSSIKVEKPDLMSESTDDTLKKEIAAYEKSRKHRGGQPKVDINE